MGTTSFMIRSSDINLGQNVFVSSQVFYKTPGDRKAYFDLHAKILREFVKRIGVYLKIPKKVTIRIMKFRQPDTHGEYCSSDKVICVSSSIIDNYEFLSNVLAHELVHAEQYHTGRLSYDNDTWIWKKGKGRVEVKQREMNRYDVYKSTPWEREAYTRQVELSDKVMSF